MADEPWTLNHFRDALASASETAGVRFETPDGPVGGGYHVTELRLHRVKAIDCGGRRADWTETEVELLDIPGERPMEAGKLASILTRSFAALPGLATAPAHVSFGHGNQGLARYEVSHIAPGAPIRVVLGKARAVCKPARDAGLSCCG